MQKRKIFTIIAAILLATVALISCMMIDNSEEAGNLVITLPTLGGRAIASTNIADLHAATEHYRVSVEYKEQIQVKSGARETFAFFVPKGAHVKITIDCLNPRGTTIVQTKKSVEMREGKKSLGINFAQDGDEVWIPADLTGKGFMTATGIKMIGITGGEVPLTASYKPKLSSFYIGETEVTQKQWQDVTGNDGYGTDKPGSSYGVGDNFPMYHVSWYDSLVFCNKLSMKEGLTPCYTIQNSTDPANWGTPPSGIRNATWDAVTCDFTANGYRLPTEAEWEYAARAVNTSTSGDQYGNPATLSTLDNYVWHNSNSGSTTHEVKGKYPNDFGLHDMSGSLWEWYWDCYDNNNSYDTSNDTDPTGPLSGQYRVPRGGSWVNTAAVCAVSNRTNRAPYDRSKDNGFRVVRSQ